MRTSVAQNGLTFTAYAGTTGVHLTWDADDALRQNLLGFAIKRRESRYRTGRWLAGGIGFPGQAHRPGVFMDTSLAPIQAFRWGDYTVYPATKYTYELVPMYGPWDALQPGPPATLEVRTEAVRGKPHSVAFNRAVAASQAYERRFPEVDPHNNVEARKWLCRDLDKFVLDFIAWGDGPQWALDVCIYEYELPEIRDALLAVRNAGTAVRLVYHSKTGDAQTEDNEASVTAGHWPAGTVRARKTSSIMHDKFMVHSRMQGGVRRPKAVMTGST
ncbi:MAG: phospholipase, partial [Actinomycetota bacterium]